MTDPLTTTAAAAILGLTRGRIRQLIAAGSIVARRHGRDYVIDRASLEAYTPGPSGWPRGRKRGPKRRAEG